MLIRNGTLIKKYGIIFTIGLCFQMCEASPPSTILSSPRETNIGEWGDWEKCPNRTFVMGMRLKTEPFQGPLDDTGLNGVQLLCGRLGESSRIIQSRRRITSLVGKWGSWGSSYECHRGYAVGFQLRSETFQDDTDNTAANNLRIYCSGTKGYLEGAGLPWGNWSKLQLCPWKYALCGLRTQVQEPQGHYNLDDTSLNNVDMECCEMNRDQLENSGRS